MFTGLGLNDEIMFRKVKGKRVNKSPLSRTKRKASVFPGGNVANKRVAQSILGGRSDLSLGGFVQNVSNPISTATNTQVVPSVVKNVINTVASSSRQGMASVNSAMTLINNPQLGGRNYALALSGDIIATGLQQRDIPVVSQVLSVVQPGLRSYREGLESRMNPAIKEEIHSSLTPYTERLGIDLKRKTPDRLMTPLLGRQESEYVALMNDPGSARKRQRTQYLMPDFEYVD